MWMCERCTWINRDTSNQCEKCAAKPAGQAEAAGASNKAGSAPQAPPARTGSDELVQPKFKRDDPLLRIQKQVLKQVDLHEEEYGQEEEHDEHIAWDSAGHLGEAVRGLAHKRRAEGASGINPPGSVADIPEIPMPSERLPNSLPVTLLITVALLLIVIGGIAFVLNDKLSENPAGDSPYDSTQLSRGLFSHGLVPSALDGLWLGTDHGISGAAASGTPVKYIFSSPDWLMVVGANSSDSDTTMAESSYHFDGKTLTTTIVSSSTAINGGAPPMAPVSATSTVAHDTLTLSDGTNTLVLLRPQDIIGTWTSAVAGATPVTFAFTTGTVTWSGVEAPGVPPAGTRPYSLSGNDVSVQLGSATPVGPTWSFTFDDGDLVLYPHQSSPGAAAALPIRLKRQ